MFALRGLLYDPKALKIITKDFFLKNRGILFDQIRLAGVESSSIPLLIAFQQEAFRYGIQLDIISVRKKPKDSGYLQTIEGKVDLVKPVMYVDDLISPNHKWVVHSITAIQKTNIPILNRMYSIVNKSTDKSPTTVVLNNPYEHFSMFDLTDFKLTHEEYYGTSS